MEERSSMIKVYSTHYRAPTLLRFFETNESYYNCLFRTIIASIVSKDDSNDFFFNLNILGKYKG